MVELSLYCIHFIDLLFALLWHTMLAYTSAVLGYMNMLVLMLQINEVYVCNVYCQD